MDQHAFEKALKVHQQIELIDKACHRYIIQIDRIVNSFEDDGFLNTNVVKSLLKIQELQDSLKEAVCNHFDFLREEKRKEFNNI